MNIWTALTCGLVIAFLTFFFFRKSLLPRGWRKRRGQLLNLSQREFQANLQQAIHDLSQLCKEQPSLTLPYLTLGNLYRLAGELQRSVVIHQNLLADANLPKKIKDRVHIELANDFIELRVEEQALDQLNQVREHSPLFLIAQEKLVELYARKKDFEKAFQAMYRILRKRHNWINRKRAAYFLALSAETMFQAGDLPTAKKTARRAQGYDRNCILALYVRSLVALEEKKYDEAIEVLTSLVRANPSYSFLALPKMEDAFYGKQSFMRLGDKLEELNQNIPDNPYLAFSLGKYYRKKKQYDQARKAFQNVLDLNLDYLPAQEEMVHLNKEEEALDKIVDHYLDFLDEAKAKKKFRCSHCHSGVPKFSWNCPVCGRWESIVADLHLLPRVPQSHDEPYQRPITANRA